MFDCITATHICNCLTLILPPTSLCLTYPPSSTFTFPFLSLSFPCTSLTLMLHLSGALEVSQSLALNTASSQITHSTPTNHTTPSPITLHPHQSHYTLTNHTLHPHQSHYTLTHHTSLRSHYLLLLLSWTDKTILGHNGVKFHTTPARSQFRGVGGNSGGSDPPPPILSHMNNDVMHTAIYATKVVYRSTLCYTAQMKLV